MTLSEVRADRVLAAALGGAVRVKTSATKERAMMVYAQGLQPQTQLPDEFAVIQSNGGVRSVTRPYGVFRGNLALTVYVKTNGDGTAKLNRVGDIIAQIEGMVHGKAIGEYYYELDLGNMITPTTTNLSRGYSMTVINVEWRTR